MVVVTGTVVTVGIVVATGTVGTVTPGTVGTVTPVGNCGRPGGCGTGGRVTGGSVTGGRVTSDPDPEPPPPIEAPAPAGPAGVCAETVAPPLAGDPGRPEWGWGTLAAGAGV